MSIAPSFHDGPYLTAAFLCEKVLVEQDGVKSAIRIIDRVTRTVAAPSPPKTMEAFDYDVILLISLKSGWARGGHSLRITLVKPSGESPPASQQTIYFEGEEDRGVDVVTSIRIRIDLTGIYWFQVFLNDIRLTQVPLRVIYLPQVLPQARQSPD